LCHFLWKNNFITIAGQSNSLTVCTNPYKTQWPTATHANDIGDSKGAIPAENYVIWNLGERL